MNHSDHEPLGLDDWEPWHPAQVKELLAGCPVPWCVAAGWALDLHHGRQTRAHEDIEIAIPRQSFAQLRPYLDDFVLYWAGQGQVTKLAPGEAPDPPWHQVWVADLAARRWRLDVFLEPGDDHVWVSHRDPRVRMPLADAIRRTADGIPYLRPELVLLAKAKHTREKDEADFARALPTLTPQALGWLRDSLALAHPGHKWSERVSPHRP